MNASDPQPLQPLLHLLQLADSAFPVGAYAYSHGLESLVAACAITGEDELRPMLAAYARQPVGRLTLPAALAAYRAASPAAWQRADLRLDAALALEPERQASLAMGARLRALLPELDPSLADDPALALVDIGAAPGHYPTVFAWAARRLRIEAPAVLGAIGTGALGSIIAAATRLGIIGHAAATRLLAWASALLPPLIQRVLRAPTPLRLGSWIPVVEIAAARHPTLPFRMFAT